MHKINQIQSFRLEIFTFLILIFLGFIPQEVCSQYIPHNKIGRDVYDFLDELHPMYNSAVKPLGRARILELLNEIDHSKLNKRQLSELSFYLKDFNKAAKIPHDSDLRLDALYVRDSSFSLTINPIGGGDQWMSAEGNAYHWWNGLYASATWGNWGFFASLTDNHESERLMSADFLTRRQGGANIKVFSGGKQDYWDSRGGVSYSWKNGHIGLIKDNFSWGSGYNGSNIFSGRTPSFVHLGLNLRPVKWFEFNYVHGWLVSEVVDSTRSFFFTRNGGNVYRTTFHGKFLAANLFTFKPWKTIHVSAGNAIVYDYNNPHPAYFIPVLFYKPVDHHLQSGMDNMNSMMFMDLSIKAIPHTHVYFTAFVDEMAVKRIFDPEEFNFLSYKGGVRFFNIVPNMYAGIEYTWSNALTYRHYVPTLTNESNRYNLGHYLEDNARELFFNLGYKPLRGLDINFSYTHAEKGPDHTLMNTPRLGIIPFSPIVWESETFNLDLSWQAIHDVWLRIGYTWMATKGEPFYIERYQPVFWQGDKGALSFGIRVGRN